MLGLGRASGCKWELAEYLSIAIASDAYEQAQQVLYTSICCHVKISHAVVIPGAMTNAVPTQEQPKSMDPVSFWTLPVFLPQRRR